VSPIELFPRNDAEARQRAESILNLYRQKRAIADAPVNPLITQSWGDGSAHSTAPHVSTPQAHLERTESAARYCEWVDGIIARLPRKRHRELLRARYCDGDEEDFPDYVAMDTIALSRSKYFECKRNALLAFASLI
jgi:ArpU family phage transcriptional regulator